MQCFQDAIECADTTQNDCDYQHLMSVYGQMAELFHAQNLPEDEIKTAEKYGQCALAIGDTLLYIRNLELLAKPYSLLGDTLGMLTVLEQAHDLYRIHGYSREAVSVYTPIIDYHIQKGHLDKASELMKVYESQSGLFNKNGEIKPGREMYYYVKGNYYLRVSDFSLAAHYFRMLLPFEKKDAYKGLLAVYQQKNEPDSLFKYASLYESALDTLHSKMHTQVIHQMSSMYNYQHFQHKANNEAEKARRMKQLLITILFLGVLGIAIVWHFLNKRRMVERMKIEKLLEKYGKVMTDWQKLVADYSLMKEENEGLIKIGKEVECLREVRTRMQTEIDTLRKDKEKNLNEKEIEIAELRGQLQQAESQLLQMRIYDQFSSFSESSVVQRLREKAMHHTAKTAKADCSDWSGLVKQFRNDMPLASSVLSSYASLTHNELCICILVLLNFHNDDIIRLMDTTVQNVTNYKTKANKKLFKEETASTLQGNLKAICLKRHESALLE